jgi:hypothetical protein
VVMVHLQTGGQSRVLQRNSHGVNRLPPAMPCSWSQHCYCGRPEGCCNPSDWQARQATQTIKTAAAAALWVTDSSCSFASQSVAATG